MTLLEGVLGMLASIIAILGGMTITVRYLAKRFDRWASAIVDNSTAMRQLSSRVARLEQALMSPGQTGAVIPVSPGGNRTGDTE